MREFATRWITAYADALSGAIVLVDVVVLDVVHVAVGVVLVDLVVLEVVDVMVAAAWPRVLWSALVSFGQDGPA